MRIPLAFAFVLAAGVPSLAGCGGGSESCASACAAPATTVLMDFSGKAGFYASPFPSDARLLPDGRVDLATFPNASATDLVKRLIGIVSAEAHGFGTTSGIFLQVSAKLRVSDLPSVQGSVAAASPVVLVSVDPASPDYKQRYPIASSFLDDGGPYGSPNLLVLLPLQGAPLLPKTRYAAVIRRALHDSTGAPLGRSPAVDAIHGGTRPDGLSDAAFQSYKAALGALPDAGIPEDDVAALTVFTTGNPLSTFGAVTAAMLAAPLPKPTKPFVRNEMFDEFCVYETTIGMPEYQQGVPPYPDQGGDWTFDAAGKPVLQRMEEANFVVTIPRRAMPKAGFPIVVLSRTGAGGERPLVDHGVQAMTGGPPLAPGTGPGLFYAEAGFAGSSIDGPHGGLRNVTHGDEQFLMFNVSNPVALRDNVRQSAAEFALQAHILEGVTVDVTDCPGVVAPGNLVHFDPGTMALMGHSMGATIAPLALAFEPRFRAGLLSGAGGSWIENIIFKLEPLPVKGIAEVLVGVQGSGYDLTEFDPMVSIFQWAAEAADPPVYGRRISSPAVGPPTNVLMMQGIVDTYILPPIANATSLSLSLDLAGGELDSKSPKLTQFTPLGELLDLDGRKAIALPATANRSGKATTVVTQHQEDGIENGHEVVFQTEGPKHEYRCFLEGFAQGMPVVPSPGTIASACDHP